MRRYFVIAAVALVFSAMNFEAIGETYKIDLREPGKEIYRGHLKLGGENPQGESVSFTNYYMEMNGAPVLPVMGEFHYSQPWWIGLKKYVPKVLEKGMYFYFKPLLPDANYIQDLPAGTVPDFSDGPVLEIKSVEAIPEYEVILSKGGC